MKIYVCLFHLYVCTTTKLRRVIRWAALRRIHVVAERIHVKSANYLCIITNICLDLVCKVRRGAIPILLVVLLFNVPNRNEALSSNKRGWRGDGVQGIVCVVAVVSKRSGSVVLGRELFVGQVI